jgi:hypothetical protein
MQEKKSHARPESVAVALSVIASCDSGSFSRVKPMSQSQHYRYRQPSTLRQVIDMAHEHRALLSLDPKENKAPHHTHLVCGGGQVDMASDGFPQYFRALSGGA